MALQTFKEPSRERENTFQKRFKLSKANSQTDEKLLWMEDNWIGKEIKHSILKIWVNGKIQGTFNSDLPMTKAFSSVQIFYRRRERIENDNLKKRDRGNLVQANVYSKALIAESPFALRKVVKKIYDAKRRNITIPWSVFKVLSQTRKKERDMIIWRKWTRRANLVESSSWN